jgi:magnesium-transporting ATPase (P-type)
LTVNIVAMFIVFFGSFILNDSPLTPVQMLWVNLIMDTLAALALASEPPDKDILDRQPQPSNESIVTIVMWRNVWGHGIYQIIVLILIIFTFPSMGLVEKYDIRCFERDDKGNCKAGSYNPYFTFNHYWNGETKLWWEK